MPRCIDLNIPILIILDIVLFTNIYGKYLFHVIFSFKIYICIDAHVFVGYKIQVPLDLAINLFYYTF